MSLCAVPNGQIMVKQLNTINPICSFPVFYSRFLSLVWSRAGPRGGDVAGQGRSCLKPAPLVKVKKLNKAKTLLTVMEVGQNGGKEEDRD